jgi:DNA adenine methylase
MDQVARFLRYPGSKRRMLEFLLEHLPDSGAIKGRFIEPFVGSGVVYFAISPKTAILGDLNRELIDLYLGIVRSPDRVWRLYRSFPSNKRGYRKIRGIDTSSLTLLQRAARSLFLNRTCFKGMWRHNLKGQFNIGYGGQDRRWSVSRRDLFEVAECLQNAQIHCCDFEKLIGLAGPKDFLFLDPPYRPGEREQLHDHYSARRFTFVDHRRLASALKSADQRGIGWALTVSDHRDIIRMYNGFKQLPIPRGTGRSIGALSQIHGGEVLITNS